MSKLETPKRETEVSLREFWIGWNPPEQPYREGSPYISATPSKGSIHVREVTAPHSSNLDAQATNAALEYCMQNKSKAIDSIVKLEERLRLAVNMIEVLMYDARDDCSGGESGQIARDALALQK